MRFNDADNTDVIITRFTCGYKDCKDLFKSKSKAESHMNSPHKVTSTDEVKFPIKDIEKKRFRLVEVNEKDNKVDDQ